MTRPLPTDRPRHVRLTRQDEPIWLPAQDIVAIEPVGPAPRPELAHTDVTYLDRRGPRARERVVRVDEAPEVVRARARVVQHRVARPPRLFRALRGLAAGHAFAGQTA